MFIREYQPSDEQEISKLFSAVFGRKLDSRFWNWRFVENPCGKGIIRLMFNRGELIGHYAVTPVNLWVKGKVHKAALSMTTMTHPDYWGRGIFTELASEVYSCCKENEIKIVFGFPNENSYHGFTQKLGWHGFGHVNGWARQRNPEHLPGEHKLVCEEMRTCDESVDDLWVRASELDSVMVARTAEFMNWRYFQKPSREYAVYSIKDHEGVLQGMLILKVFCNQYETAGHIIDILAVNQPEIQHAILTMASEFFAERKLTNITCWISSYNPIASQLPAMGFSLKEWPTYAGVKVLDDAFVDASFVMDPNHWSFTMGDSDVF